MSPEQYRNYLSNKLIREFQDRFYDKIGLLPIVTVPLDNVKKPTPSEIELVLNQEIPSWLLDMFPTITSKTRKREIVMLRQIFIYILRSEYKYGLTSLGNYLNKDHTTIIHSFRAAEYLIKTDTDFNALYHKILSKVKYHVTNTIPETTGDGDNTEPVYDTMAYQE